MSNLVLVNKPKGITSFRVVAILKRKLNIKRIGHTGTLDPMATGVLPLLTGRASRLSSLMLDSEKAYKAVVRLGTTTDTLDITGAVLSTSKVNVTDEELQKAVNSFLGHYMQTPPMYSALKKDGVRLYDLARQGIEVERKAREVEIKKISLVKRINQTDFIIEVLCSKGTYIRSLALDIGEKLGVGATLLELERTLAAGFSIDECTPLDVIEQDETLSFLKSAEDAVRHLNEVFVSDKQAIRFANGGQLGLERLKCDINLTDGEKIRVKHGNELIGIGTVNLKENRVDIACIIKE